mmetsp:Transcript_5159/g.11153  ORF Transcript_5159/g.11153 Transcript_5159/m.11153 type:complete len:964 (+) Transcript_5159:651-3542(+)
MGVNLPRVLWRDISMLHEAFLPGFRFNHQITKVTSLIVSVSFVWLWVYFRFLYQNDRSEHLSHWHVADEGTILPEEISPGGTLPNSDVIPDLIVVFHHPSHQDQPDKSKVAAFADLHKVLVAEVPTWKVLPEEGVSIHEKPSLDAPILGHRPNDAIMHGHEEDGWVALDGAAGFVSLQVEGSIQEEDLEGMGSACKQLERQSGKPLDLEAFGLLRDVAKRAFEASSRSRLDSLSLAKRLSIGQHEEQGPNREKESPPSLAMAREALLKDIYAVLPRWGFDATVFSSVDVDEIYVCISLDNVAALESYLLRNNVSLQIQQELVPKLGVRQPNEVTSSPPFLRYDPRVVKMLHNADILDSDDARKLFKTHYGKSAEGCIVKGSDRFNMIFRQLCEYVDLDAAKNAGVICDWYPAHSQHWIHKLRATWGSFGWIGDLSFRQPVTLIHDYFGARVAFIFAWNGHYCKALFALSVLATLVFIGTWIARHYFESSTVYKRVVLAFSIVTLVWGRVASNMWFCEQRFFLKLWEANQDTHEAVRPSFQGEKGPSPVDLNLLEKQYPASAASLRRFLSTMFTLVFCAFVGGCIILWTNIFEGSMDASASIWLSIMIVFFQQVYNLIVPRLTEWENHKHQSEYYNSYVFKQFLFESVNRYCAFFFLALKQRYTKVGCPKGGCMAALNTHLTITLLILSATRIAQIFFAVLLVRAKIWWEDYNLKKARALRLADASDSCGDGNNSGKQEGFPHRSYAELQSKFAPVRLQEQIDSMMQLVLSLGFVLLFGPVAPIIVPFCLVVFVVQMRGSAYLYSHFAKRSLPRHQYGIGIWADIIKVLMMTSCILSGFLIVVYGDTFAGTPLLTRLVGMILYVAAMQLVWLLVDLVCPPNSDDVRLLKARRERVRHVLLERATDFTNVEGAIDGAEGDLSSGSPRLLTRGETSDQPSADLASVVQEGKWDDIPCFDHADYLKK